ncbi:uncharacterized protein LOC116005825 [Ipomoea triloba]|uniref:uncharacterized protein LOC116005825 n=1 Tax=Ipomoea triloba TaxID=35885 RepID=UPI00125D63D1|nr:uncharacterized protein LOC116005825 [Ipomoea triloba]
MGMYCVANELSTLKMGMYCVANELSTFKNKSAMKLRVIRTYLVPLRRGSLEIKSQEIVFHDSEGTVIHAHVPKTLVENTVIHAHVPKTLTYKTSMHEYMLQFNHETIMKEIRSDKFPWHMYRLKPFNSLKGNPTLDDKHLIDIIGRIVQIHGPQEKIIGGHNTRLIDFVLEDAL